MAAYIFTKDAGCDRYGDPIFKAGEVTTTFHKWMRECEDCWDYATAQQIWDAMPESECDPELCRELFEEAGRGEEYDALDGDDFERSLFSVLRDLGIEEGLHD